MGDEDEDDDRHKKVTAAITDEPQEEFINDANIPTIPENDPDKLDPDDPRQRKSTAG